MIRVVFVGIPSLLIIAALFMVIAPRATLARLQRWQGRPADPAGPDERSINAVLVSGMILLASGLIALVGGLAAILVLTTAPGSKLLVLPN